MKSHFLLLRLLPAEREIVTYKKRILKAKSPGKKLRDQRRLNQFKAKRRLLFSFAATDNCLLEENGSGTEDSGTSSDLDFSECERMDELDQTKTETLASDTDAMNDLKELFQTFTCLESSGRHV